MADRNVRETMSVSRRLSVPVRRLLLLVLSVVLTAGLSALVNSASAGAATPKFTDVPVSSPFYADISWLVSEGVTTGYADGGFHPTAPVTREAMAAFLYRLTKPGQPAPKCTSAPFTDVAANSPFCPEISWLVGQGVTTGYADGGFHPLAAVSRQAMAAFLDKLSGGTTTCNFQPFTDVPLGGDFCAAITWLVFQGVTEGYADGGFHPAAAVSRQAMAAFLHRLKVPTTPTPTTSHYLRSTATLAAAGASDAQQDNAAPGTHLHVLDIGAQTITNLTGPGVLLNSTDTRLLDADLVTAVQQYLNGYAGAATAGTTATVVLATNNDGDFSTFTAAQKGTDWATNVVAAAQAHAPAATKVVGGIDIEASFASTQAQAAQWEAAYLAVAPQLVNVGSADGCPTTAGLTGASCQAVVDDNGVTKTWTQAQYYALAHNGAGITLLPQIYLPTQAVQWANIDATGGKAISFAGALSEYQTCPVATASSCTFASLAPRQAWSALADALSAIAVTPANAASDLRVN